MISSGGADRWSRPADIIYKFYGFLAQVKMTSEETTEFSERIMGAAWGPRQARILAGIYHGLYIVGYRRDGKKLVRIDFVDT